MFWLCQVFNDLKYSEADINWWR